jgi:hypothetical protein
MSRAAYGTDDGSRALGEPVVAGAGVGARPLVDAPAPAGVGDVPAGGLHAAARVGENRRSRD